MLLAVIMGWEQPRRSFLSRRRSIRRLLLASFRRMLGFTRNPSGRRMLEKADTSFNTGNAQGFRVSPNNHPIKPGDLACLRPRGEARPLVFVPDVTNYRRLFGSLRECRKVSS